MWVNPSEQNTAKCFRYRELKRIKTVENNVSVNSKLQPPPPTTLATLRAFNRHFEFSVVKYPSLGHKWGKIMYVPKTGDIHRKNKK